MTGRNGYVEAEELEDAGPEGPEVSEVEAAEEPEAEDDGHKKKSAHLPNPKIPPIKNTQAWVRTTSFFDYFGNNYKNRNTKYLIFVFGNHFYLFSV